MQAVEVATIKIKAGSNVFDRGSEAARIWRGMLDTISRQKGCQTLYSGQEHESPNIVQLLVGMQYQAPISTKSRWLMCKPSSVGLCPVTQEFHGFTAISTIPRHFEPAFGRTTSTCPFWTQQRGRWPGRSSVCSRDWAGDYLPDRKDTVLLR